MNRSQRVPVVGLIGGVGAGKSAVAQWFAARRCTLLLDGDAIGHELLDDERVREAIRDRFGPDVFDVSGAVDRRALGAAVFGDDEARTAARRDLESLLHPRIGEEIERRIGNAGDVEYVLLDAALALEAGWDDRCDLVVFVDTPWENRLEHVARSRGWTMEDLRLREASQMPLDEKRRRADVVIVNDGTLDDVGGRLLHEVEKRHALAEQRLNNAV